MFTGSTDVARLLARSLAGRLDERGRPLVLIAETGGQNALIVDSSALPEQVVGDALTSAFDSAGQRCSALRVLCVQDDVAERVVGMLDGALAELRLAPPDRLSTDVGPVIDEDAQKAIVDHIDGMRRRGRRVTQLAAQDAPHGHFVAPTIVEIGDVAELEREVFGPVLHVVRYPRAELGRVIDAVNATGYGLTLGLHTRIDETIEAVVERAHAGNQYVNRNMIGAVVGVQPFGGEGLSGTGPKAGGPLYLRRLLAEAPIVSPLALGAEALDASAPALHALEALRDWLATDPSQHELAEHCGSLAYATPVHRTVTLRGPTGERNTYALLPRSRVLSIALDRGDLLFQLATILGADTRAAWLRSDIATALHAELPTTVARRVDLIDNSDGVHFDVALIQADQSAVREWSRKLARQPGPIVGLHAAPPGARDVTAFAIERLLVERSVSVNTAAAGGNASLMTIG
jgi:RHH-type proline utilization regulon transcriptional repressor/proline dehydrogenase/delta 1-pyrroline-5-carboxylate dehydrogenase